jgi:hypothetical protein
MLPKAKAQLTNYTKFWDVIVKLYPGADDERKYAESDFQQLIDSSSME